VDVHVGKSGDDELAGQVELDGAAGDRDPADADDAIAVDEDRLVAIPASGGDVDDGGR
jgi:hypothetical protein